MTKDGKSGVSSEQTPPPPPPPLRSASSSSGKSVSRKSWIGISSHSPSTHVSPQRFSPKFNDSFTAQSLDTLHFETVTADLNWSWDSSMNIPSLQEQDHPTLVPDFSSRRDDTGYSYIKADEGDAYEEELVQDEHWESIQQDQDQPSMHHDEDFSKQAKCFLHSFPILAGSATASNSAANSTSFKALSHPYNGNIIVCRSRPPRRNHRRGKITSTEEWVLDEIDPTCHNNRTLMVVASTPILSSALMEFFSSCSLNSSTGPSITLPPLSDMEWTHKRPIGIKQVIHITCGVESKHSYSSPQVYVAAILDLFVISHSIIKMKKEGTHSSYYSSTSANTKNTNNTCAYPIQDVTRVIAVWEYCNGKSTMALRQVLPPPRGNFLYDPNTLALADGFLFLGGSMKGYPHIFSLSLNTSDSWSCTSVTTTPLTTPLNVSNASISNETPVKESEPWDTSIGVATRVVALASTLYQIRRYKYLAVALDNGDLCVMTYHSQHSETLSIQGKAVDSTKVSANDFAKSYLQLLIILHGHSNLHRSETPHLMEDIGPYDQETPFLSEYKKNHCTQLAWIFPGPSCNNLPLLAAAYPNGVLIYLISLKYAQESDVIIESSHPKPTIIQPISKDTTVSASPFRKKTTSNSDSISHISSMANNTSFTISKSLALLPLYISRIFEKGKESRTAHSCYVAWLDMGSRFPPCLGILCVDLKRDTHLILTSLNMDHSSRMNHIEKICSQSLGTSLEQDSVGLLSSASLCSVLHVTGESVTAFTPYLRKFRQENRISNLGPDRFLAHLTKPVISSPLGIDSNGCVTQDLIDDFVLHIFSSIQCIKYEYNPKLRLRLNHFLCMTTFGDRKGVCVDEHSLSSRRLPIDLCDREKSSVTKIGSNVIEPNTGWMKSFTPSEPTGGASSCIIKDLSCHNHKFQLRPERISIHKQWVAVLFTRATPESEGIMYVVPEYVAIFNKSKITNDSASDKYDLYEGRDISFFSSGDQISAFIINPTGTYIKHMLFQENGWIHLRSFSALPSRDYSIHRIHILNKGNVVCSGQDKSNMCHLYSAGTCKLANSGSGFDFYRAKHVYDTILLDYHEDIDQFLEARETDDSKDEENVITIASFFHLITMRVIHGKLQVLYKVCKQSLGSLAPIGTNCTAHLSFATTTRQVRLEYSSNLKGIGSKGIIATFLISTFTNGYISLLALRPDRFIYLNEHSFSDLLVDGNNSYVQRIPLAFTRPTCPLEPLISNYIAQSLSQGTSKSYSKLLNIIEKFKPVHSDNKLGLEQQLGPFGKELISTSLSMLNCHGFNSLVEEILQSSVSSRVRTFPTHISHLTQNLDKRSVTTMGDLDPSNCTGIKKTTIHLPLPSDPSSTIARLRAHGALQNKLVAEALANLDLAGDCSSDEEIYLLALSVDIATAKSVNRNSSISENVIKREPRGLTENNGILETITDVPSSTPLASLSRHLKSYDGDRNGLTNLTSNSIIRQFSFSHQKGLNTLLRSRDSISSYFSEATIPNLMQDNSTDAREESTKNFSDEKFIWSTGPFDDKEKLLQLSSFEHWLGSRFLPVLGKEGVDAIAATGDNLLASLVIADMNCAESRLDDSSARDELKGGWIDGIGEGRSDEDNVTLYLRFSEGVDQDRSWIESGFQDLSQYNNSVLVLGQENLTLQDTSSGVDEGENGKAKLLFDLVFDGMDAKRARSFLCVEVRRGSSLDLGCWHYHETRQRGSLEFWYYCPERLVYDEIILARRSVCIAGKSAQSLADEPIENHLLWELVLQSNRCIEFRTQSGALSCSTIIRPNTSQNDNDYDSDESGSGNDFQRSVYQGWNHVCVSMNSRNCSESVSRVSLIVKGALMATSALRFDLPSLDIHNNLSNKSIDEILDRTFLLFGLGAHSGFRMTELRHWACERSADDTKMMMYEYLSVAETRRKLQVKIRHKNVLSKPGLVSHNSLAPPRPFRISETTNGLNPTSTFTPIENSFTTQQTGKNLVDANECASIVNKDAPICTTFQRTEEKCSDEPVGHIGDMNPITSSMEVKCSYALSKYMKTSIVTAIVRGPSATNHFGGNSGGLPCHSLERETTRNITICGTEKTVIFSCDDAPTATTYPIGAASTILWMENDSKYLACFQAKDKRIIVFDLRSNTVMVELQTSLKLMFWRYLPPSAHGENVTIMLVTSSGGFHFSPLDESPRPRPVFGKYNCLQGKRVQAYEEGGSNGGHGQDLRSTVGLLLLSSQKPSSVEAHCLLLFESLPQASLCISTDVLGAALFLPIHLADVNKPTLPFVVIVSMSEVPDFEFVVELFELVKRIDGTLVHGTSLTRSLVPKISSKNDDDILEEQPSLTMGLNPKVLCLCCNDHIVFVQRATGNLFIYKYSKCDHSLLFIGRYCFRAFVADATIRVARNTHEQIEVTSLLGGGQISLILINQIYSTLELQKNES